MKKSTKGTYRSKIADSKLATAMDILSDEYRVKEKMFPVSVSFGPGSSLKNGAVISFKSLFAMAQFVREEPWFGKEDSYINRYDEDGMLIKKHIHRTIEK